MCTNSRPECVLFQYNRAYCVLKQCVRLQPKNPVPMLHIAQLCYEHLHQVCALLYTFTYSYHTVILQLLLFAFRDLWKEWGDSNFQIFSQNCQFPHRRLESLEHFNVLLYFILSTTVSFLEYTILFLQVFFFHFVYISIFCSVDVVRL